MRPRWGHQAVDSPVTLGTILHTVTVGGSVFISGGGGGGRGARKIQGPWQGVFVLRILGPKT